MILICTALRDSSNVEIGEGRQRANFGQQGEISNHESILRCSNMLRVHSNEVGKESRAHTIVATEHGAYFSSICRELKL